MEIYANRITNLYQTKEKKLPIIVNNKRNRSSNVMDDCLISFVFKEIKPHQTSKNSTINQTKHPKGFIKIHSFSIPMIKKNPKISKKNSSLKKKHKIFQQIPLIEQAQFPWLHTKERKTHSEAHNRPKNQNHQPRSTPNRQQGSPKHQIKT